MFHMSNKVELHHLIHVTRDPPPDLLDVWVILGRLLGRQDGSAGSAELGGFPHWARQQGWAEGDHAEGAWRGDWGSWDSRRASPLATHRPTSACESMYLNPSQAYTTS